MAIQALKEHVIIPVPAIHIRDAKTAADYERVGRLLRDWSSNIENRFGFMRAHSKIDLSIEFSAKVEADRSAKDQYKTILSGIRDGISKTIKPYAKDLSAEISAVADFHLREIIKDPHTQAIATYKIQPSVISAFGHVSLMVGFLATAPWNLSMHAPNDEDFELLKTPGSGAVMLKSLVEKALASGCSFLYLKPLDGSVGFYHHMGMVHDEKSDYFHLDLRLKIGDAFTKSQSKFLGIALEDKKPSGADSVAHNIAGGSCKASEEGV